MPTWTKWTPELIAERLTAAHAHWLLDTKTGKAARRPFNPAYLVMIGQRQVHGQHRDDGLFDAALALVPDAVRKAWKARGYRSWTQRSAVKRLKELFEAWRTDAGNGKPAGKSWALSYLLAADPSFVRCAPRNGIDLEALVKRIGGEMRLLWRAKRRLERRPRTKRTVPTAAKALIAAYEGWLTDQEFGLPAGRAFGVHFLVVSGEGRLGAWLCRGKKKGRIEKVLARVPAAVKKAWTRKRSP
ncbi:hypothetical protein EPO33_01045 [Patescibacteria group bacterium]|nr:MAG: hypothetical protein EPO33_01045 [Patescibacteria group bacterium]